MKRHERRRLALRRLGRVCEGLEPRQFLSGDGLGIQLLPAGFDPAAYADIGPQLATTESSQAPATAAAEEADVQARFASATELEDYLLDAAVRRYEYSLGKTFDYNPFGRWNWELVTLYTNFGNSSDATYTTTNVQESGVDEADLVETDGEYIYLLQGEELLIFDARPAEQLKLVSRTKVEGNAVGLYLDGDRLTVITQDYGPVMIATFAIWPGPPQQGSVKVAVFNVADRNLPKLVSQTEFDGQLVSSRSVEGRVYLTINANLELPQPLATQIEPPNEGNWGRWQVETAEAYRARVRPLLQATLPHYSVRTVGSEGPRELLSAPTDIYKATGLDDTSLTTVVVIDARAERPQPIGSATVMGTSGQMIYSSADNLYVLASRWSPTENGVGRFSTEIRKFHFTNSGIELAATGEVDGQVLNQFSLSEHAGYLRVATTENWGATAKNHLFVLGEQGTELAVVGSVRDLAPGERIFSARLMGNRGFIVTFRQVDPLFTLDLTDPANPRVVGELKLPGFSNYLQVLDENTVLGIGRDADPITGQQTGLQVTIFDVSDMAAPKVKDQYRFAGDAWTSADYDHHQVLYDPEYHTLAFPVTTGQNVRLLDADSWQSDTALWVFDVSPSLGVELRGKTSQSGTALRGLRIADVLYSISSETVLAAPMLQPEAKLGEVRYSGQLLVMQNDPFQPGKSNLVLGGSPDRDRFELGLAADGRLEVKRGGQVIGLFDQTTISRVVVSALFDQDRLLVRDRRALAAEIETFGVGNQVDLGDIDGDGQVGLSDFALLKSQLGQHGADLSADIDRDGDVDLDDSSILRSNFGLEVAEAVKQQSVFATPVLRWGTAIDVAFATLSDE